MGKSRDSANLVADSNVFSDITNDRVGIGSTVPTTKLDVAGDVRISGVITSSSFRGSVNSSGVSTIGTLYGTNVEYDNLYVDVGISTVIRGTNLNYTGIGTLTNLRSTNISISGLSTFTDTVELDGGLRDFYGRVGAAGSVLTSTGAGVSWRKSSNFSAINFVLS